MFASTKAGHLAHILTTSLMGSLLTSELEAPTPSEIEAYGHLIIQTLVGLVTIWTMIRKSLQQPEKVMQMPAAATTVVVAPGPAVEVSGAPAVTPTPPAVDRRVPDTE